MRVSALDRNLRLLMFLLVGALGPFAWGASQSVAPLPPVPPGAVQIPSNEAGPGYANLCPYVDPGVFAIWGGPFPAKAMAIDTLVNECGGSMPEFEPWEEDGWFLGTYCVQKPRCGAYSPGLFWKWVLCPTGYAADVSGVCIQNGPAPDKNPGPCPGGSCDCCAGNPIHIAFGNKYQAETDLRGLNPEGLQFVRHYNSNFYKSPLPPGHSAIGQKWRHTYMKKVVLAQTIAVTTAYVYRETGKILAFSKSGSSWVADSDVNDRLVQLLDASGNPTGWVYTTADNHIETYDVGGRLLSVRSASGLTQSLSYDAAGNLAAVADSYGRTLAFTYGALGRIATMTDQTGAMYQYGYSADSIGNLVSVTFPAAIGETPKTRTYLYNEVPYRATSLPTALTGIVDENAARFATYRYDSGGRAYSSEHAGGVEKFTFNFASAFAQTQLTDPLGLTRTYTLSTVLGVPKVTAVSDPCVACGNPPKSAAIDTNGNVSSRTDFNNKKVCYTYDLSRNLETARAEGILSTETCSTVLATLPARPDVRKVSTQWHPTWRLPVTIAEPNRITTFAYHGDIIGPPPGHLVRCAPLSIGVLCQKTVQETTDATGQRGFAATLTGTPRVWQYTYDQYGQVLAATDPNSKTTTTVYYAATDTDLGKRGNVQTITNPLGHVTTFTAYDGNGRPLSITDPNGTVTTLTYWPRGWLHTRTVAGETTTYDYDGVGQLTKVTQPDSSYVQYTYDSAHRLTQIQDGLGNKIVYTLDAMGNRIKEEARDPSGQLARIKQQVYDNLNRLHQSVGAQ